MTMTKTHRSALVLALVALAAAEAAGAATIRSPYASSASPAVAARLAADGQEGLDLDTAAAAALMERTDQILEIEAFPIAPGTTKTLRLHRFEVAAPGARITIRGPAGETSLPMPSVSHFAGIVEGEPDSSVYIGATGDRVVAYVHSSLGHSYVGPDETERGFVVRMAESPMNAAAASVSWRCRTEELPAALTAMARAAPSRRRSCPTLAFKQATVLRRDRQPALHALFGRRRKTVDLRPHALRRDQRHLRARPRPAPVGHEHPHLVRRRPVHRQRHADAALPARRLVAREQAHREQSPHPGPLPERPSRRGRDRAGSGCSAAAISRPTATCHRTGAAPTA